MCMLQCELQENHRGLILFFVILVSSSSFGTKRGCKHDNSFAQERNKRSMLHFDTVGIFPNRSLVSFTSNKILEPFILL